MDARHGLASILRDAPQRCGAPQDEVLNVSQALRRSLRHAPGAKGMDGEVILRVNERRGARPAGAEGAAAERLDGVFVAVLGMNGLAAAEVERLAAGANPLPRQTDEMHLDAALFGVVAGAMAEGGRVELAAKLVIDARKQVEVEGRRNAGMVVIGCGEGVRVFD